MSESRPTLEAPQEGGSAAALRHAFDASFALPPASNTEPLEGLLAIRVGADPFAIRLSEVAGLLADPRIVPVPSPVPQLLGIVGRRGVMAPVYDLAAVLNYPPAASVRWMVLVGATHAVGFAFETFEAHLQVSSRSLGQAEGMAAAGGAPHADMQGMVRAAGALRPVIHLTSLLQRLRSQHP